VLELAAVKPEEEKEEEKERAGAKAAADSLNGPRRAKAVPSLRKDMGAEANASEGGEGGAGGEGGEGGAGGEGGEGGAAAEAAAATQAERAAVLGNLDALEQERPSEVCLD
jgi:hypothetical protein